LEEKPKLSGRDEAMLTAIACSDPPEGYGRWTIRLLAYRLVELGVVDSILSCHPLFLFLPILPLIILHPIPSLLSFSILVLSQLFYAL